MVSRNIVHVVIVPTEKPGENLISTVAAILGKEPYGTRLLLSGKMPKLVAHYQSSAEAEATVQSLKTLGLTAFICGDTFLRRPTSVTFTATILQVGEGEVIFSNQVGDNRVIKGEDIFLIIKCNRQTTTETKTTTAKLKFSVGKTLLTGGIPVWSKVEEKTTTKSTQDELCLRLYDHNSPDAVVEISQHTTDYTFLGQKRAYSSLANFNTVVNELRNVLPAAIFDDRLVRLSAKEVSSNAEDDLEMNCRLLYLYYRTLSDSPQFRLEKA